MALLVTSMSSKPAARTFLRSTVAPIAEEPMPASQAKTIFSMGPVWLESSAATPAAPAAPPPVRAPETEDFLPFICSIFAVAEVMRSEEHTSELQSRGHLVCRLLLDRKKAAPP